MRITLLVVFSCAVIAVGVLATVRFGNSNMNDAEPGGFPSRTIKDAINDNIFVGKFVIDPATAVYGDKVVQFDEAWIEERSIVEYRYLLFKSRKPIGGYQVVVACRDAASNRVMLWETDSAQSFASLQGRYCSPSLREIPEILRLEGRLQDRLISSFSVILRKVESEKRSRF